MPRRSPGPYAWEAYGPLEAGYGEEVPGAEWDDSASDGDVPPQQAGEEFADLLVRLRLQGTLSAKQACVLAHWATLAGAVGPATQFAARPSLPTGHYQRRLDAYLGIDSRDSSFYMLDVPGHDKAQADRTVHHLETRPPHEALAREVEAEPQLLERVAAAAAAGDWAASYARHPVVLAAEGAPVLPLALYIDGVPFTVQDSFLGFWVYNLLSMRRHLVAVVRKSQLCACGCRKWCSIWVVLEWLRWSFSALATGAHPTRRHDGSPWTPADGAREAAAGTPLVRGALVLLKGDWSEFCLTLGFPTWGSGAHPCLFCHSDRDSLYKLQDFHPGSFPHALKTDAQVRAACAAAEIRVVLSADLHRQIAAALFYDKRKQGSHGRALRRAVPQAGLEKGDRLEPSSELRDVALFDSLSRFPTTVTFWRPGAETMAKHRNPLFAEELGIGLDAFAVDTLHTLHLGVYQKLLARIWWLLLLQDAWGVAELAGGRWNQEELLANGVLRLRAALQRWYGEWDAAHPGNPVNRLQDLTLKTLGDRDALCIRTKAAETRPLLRFTVALAREFRAVLDADSTALLPAAEELLNFSELVRAAPRVLRPADAQALHDSLNRYARLSLAAQIPPIPKLHLALHLVHRTARRPPRPAPGARASPGLRIRRAGGGGGRRKWGAGACVRADRTAWQGSPALAATFLDESANGRARDMAARLHRSTWTRRFFQFWERLGSGKRRLD